MRHQMSSKVNYMGWDIDSKQISSNFGCCCFASFYFFHSFRGREAVLCFHHCLHTLAFSLLSLHSA